MRTALLFVLLFVSSNTEVPPVLAPPNNSPTRIQFEQNLLSSNYEVVVFINDVSTGLGKTLRPIENALKGYASMNPSVGNKLDVIPFPEHPNRKLIFASTGDLSSDVSNSRDIRNAVQAAFQATTGLGFKKVLMVVGPMNTAQSAKWSKGKYAQLNAAMAAMHKLFYPYIVRLLSEPKQPKCEILGLFEYETQLIHVIEAIGHGMEVLRDIGNTEPEVMVAKTIEEYINRRMFADWEKAGITLTVDDPTEDKYPMCYRVNRGSSVNELHAGKIIKVEYTGEGKINETLLLVGKGVTFDSGGHDLKINGGMNGMHNDKLGAATVAGFFEILSYLKPQGLKVIGYMPYIRNDIGKLGYVADEIVTLTNGLRVRIGDTDAEGRNILTDVLIQAKDQALKEVNPHIFTFATLTGSASRSFGPYTVLMDNGPARAVHMAEELMEIGDLVSDPGEVARIRYEDFLPNMANSEYANIEQYNTKPGSVSKRGFSFAGGFLQMVSQLDQHGVSSKQPLKYTHCDIAGSAEGATKLATASPLRMFAAKFIIPRIMSLE